MVRLAALLAAYAGGLAGTALAAPAQAGSDVVRGENRIQRAAVPRDVLQPHRRHRTGEPCGVDVLT
jgi:hypothetical protein